MRRVMKMTIALNSGFSIHGAPDSRSVPNQYHNCIAGYWHFYEQYSLDCACSELLPGDLRRLHLQLAGFLACHEVGQWFRYLNAFFSLTAELPTQSRGSGGGGVLHAQYLTRIQVNEE